jgi:single-strand DNA-binding protein
MANDTLITIVGNLTGDPDLCYTPTGTARATFTVAATPRAYDKNSGGWRDGETLFMACTAWRELAVNVAESLTKGTRVIVSGRLRQSRWEDRETGEKRQMMQLDADEIGPSLKFAAATVKKLTRTSATSTGSPPPDDPWAATSTTRPDPAGSAFDPAPF